MAYDPRLYTHRLDKTAKDALDALFLSGALNATENSGLIFRNPAKCVKLKKGEKKRRPYITDGDVRRLIIAAEGHPWQIGIIILVHGLRISEMLALRHSSIIEADGVLCFDVKHAVKEYRQAFECHE